MNTSLAVANHFIDAAIRDGVELTNMKLVKLGYVAHGWHLGHYGTPLIDESVEAWKYGPVLPDVYHWFKDRGSSGLRENDKVPLQEIISKTKPNRAKFLDLIWNTYKDWSAINLSSATHAPGTPWDKIVMHENKGYVWRHLVIPNEVIKDYYLKKINDNSIQGI